MSRHSPTWTLVMAVSASSLSFITGSILNVALPAIREGLNASAAEAQWVINAYTLPVASLILIGGALGDHHGRRFWLMIGTTVFGGASLLCALSGSLQLLLGGRALQGVGAALVLPNSLALLNGAYEGEARGRAVGIWAAASAGASAAAPLVGGWLVDNIGWPSIFYVNLPFAAAAIVIALTRVEESKGKGSRSIDVPGAVLATLGLGAITYGLTIWSADQGLSAVSGTSIAAGLAILAAFIGVERRAGAKAMIPVRYFGESYFSALNLVTFLLYGAFGAALLLIPYVLITAGGYSATDAGLAMLPLPLIIGAGSPLMGKLASRIGPRWPLTVGPLIVASGLLLATRIASDQAYWSNVFPAIAVIAVGMAVAVAPLTSAMLVSVDPEHTGMVSGFNTALARAGRLVAIASLGAVLAMQGQDILGPFPVALTIGAAIAAVAAIAAFIGLGHQHHGERQPSDGH